jgi:hypothetical protein
MILIFYSLAGLLFVAAAGAHHSVPVNFDTQSDHTISGILKKTKWVNPHSQMRVEVTKDDGTTETWLVEMNALNTIRRLGRKMGFTTDDFVVGEEITIGGWLGRHGRAIYFRRAKLASGKEIIWQSRLDPDLAKLPTN